MRTGRSTSGSTSTGTGEAEAGEAGTVIDLDVGFIKEAGYTGTGPRVAVYGDSLTVAATPLLRKMFEDLSVRIVAMNGEGYDGGPWTNYLKSEGALVTEAENDPSKPDVFVICMGINDVTREPGTDSPDGSHPHEASLAGVRRLVAAAGEACTVLVTVAEHSEHPNFDAEKARALNVEMRRHARHVIEFGPFEAMRGPDSVHLGEEGTRALAEAIHEAVRVCLAT